MLIYTAASNTGPPLNRGRKCEAGDARRPTEKSPKKTLSPKKQPLLLSVHTADDSFRSTLSFIIFSIFASRQNAA